MEREQDQQRRIGTGVAVVVAVALGLGLLYLGGTMVRFGVFALGEGETFIGLASLVLGAGFVIAPLVVLGSQVRASSGRRG